MLHQERQYRWLSHDANLEYLDLALFGYHHIDDWFGTKFPRLIAEFVINAAVIAKEKGYEVTKEEALADLIRNAKISFKENQAHLPFSVASPGDYMEQQLVRMRMDRNQAIKIWQQVLLFRRLFHDVGNAVFVDRSGFDAFNHFASEEAVGDLYRLPEAMRLTDFNALVRFEIYLDAISKRSKQERDAGRATAKVLISGRSGETRSRTGYEALSFRMDRG